jgi:hypothetical protein
MMMADAEADPRTVLSTDSPKVADTVIEWLAAEGIAAELIVPRPSVSSDPLTGLTEGPAEAELEVRVIDMAKVEDARKLLSDAQRTARLHAIRDERAKRTGTVTAICEECGKPSEWPATAMGTTETCPHCTAYMDIPDPEDDWSEVDFGEPEEAESEESDESEGKS